MTPTRAPTQLRRASRLISHAPMAMADTMKPQRATWGNAASSLNQPWAKASAASPLTSASPPGVAAAGSSPAAPATVLATVSSGVLVTVSSGVLPSGTVAPATDGATGAVVADTVGSSLPGNVP